ncbi:IscS subfamily cysteine desulfurase [Bacillus massilinigeriensis]|uniref:IscS subfamily cysteine desulfurase n=1 Tax=Bacillus mediterraneensis TaxID=1805474 RepID=UPI0008F91FB2|nr:IscS subfamily cysteine desulfurase [Bacillus mediterraneensis]
MIYFDYAATCPLDSNAATLYVEAATQLFGNSQSLHDTGGEAKALLENCRKTLSNLLGVDPDGLYFTSGGSESNDLAIRALLSSIPFTKRHIIVNQAEHASVLGTIEMLQNNGYHVTMIPMTASGHVDLERLEESADEHTALISVQHANSEIGTLQPIEEIARICDRNKILLHSDFVQSFGKTEVKHITPFVDALTISGHKFYGPKGTGAAYIRPSIAWKRMNSIISHEKGFRPGTVNVPGIIAMTSAAENAVSTIESTRKLHKGLRNKFLNYLMPIADKMTLHGSDEKNQLPGIVGLSIHGMEGQWVMLEANRKGFAISAGTACSLDMQNISPTMMAMGVEGKKAKEFFRISFGRNTTESDVNQLGQFLHDLTT